MYETAHGWSENECKKERLRLCLQAKISHGDETRVIHLANQITYAELLDTVKQKFPNAWPFQLKYLDRCASS